MGAIVSKNRLAAGQPIYRLTVDCTQSNKGQAISVSKLLTEELLKVQPQMRSMRIEKCLLNVLAKLPDDPIIKDIDVMFNPVYVVDVLQVLISAYRQKPFSLIWPGTCSNGNLVYAEEGYRDYKTYDVNSYDIVCFI